MRIRTAALIVALGGRGIAHLLVLIVLAILIVMALSSL